MEEIKKAKLKDLIQDDRNLNKGTERGQELIEKSLREFGAGRSLLLDKNNRIIAGNKTHKNAEALGMDDVIIVETDGTKLVAVKRTDVDLDTKKGREMALADNATVKVDLEWDTEQMESIAEEFGIDTEQWGFDLGGDDNPYTMKVESPVYEAKGEQPKISELTDREKADELLAEINDTDGIDEDVKEFLRCAATRHIVFDYGKIAEYYCHATPAVQRLMEKSALVIIDFNQAIEGGYVQLRDSIRELMKEDVFGDD